MTNCYRCNEPGTTREHVPADSFFPADKKHNLITVPSCETHNTKKSKDDEYARNLFTLNAEMNEVGLNHGLDKTVRSFKRSPSFLRRVFGNWEASTYKGIPTHQIPIEIDRLTEYVSGWFYGLYRHEYGKNFEGDWYVLFDFLTQDHNPLSKYDDQMKAWLRTLRNARFPKRIVGQPDVFDYSVMEQDGKCLFRIVMYEKIRIYGTDRIIIDKINGET